MAKFRKKPVVVEAVQWSGSNVEEVAEFLGTWGYISNFDLFIKTLEGDMRAGPLDFVIKGIKGEFYPCKPDIFAATYEPVVED